MIKRTAFFLAAIALVGIALAGCGGEKSCVPSTVATVNGKSIPRDTYVEFLNMASSKQVLATLLEQQILLDWAEKEGVPVTDKQLDQQIAVMKRDGNYETSVTAAGCEQALKDSYRGVQARINLGEKLYTFPDSDLAGMYKQMATRYVHGPRKSIYAIISPDPKQIAAAQTAIKNGTDFDVASIRYSDKRFTTDMQTGQQKPIGVMIEKGVGPPAVQAAAEQTKVGEASKPFEFSAGKAGTMHAIIKVTAAYPKMNISLDKAKPELKQLAAMQKTVTDPTFTKKLNEQKKKADIKVDLPQDKYVVEQIKNPPPPSPMMMPGAGAQPQPNAAPKGAPKGAAPAH